MIERLMLAIATALVMVSPAAADDDAALRTELLQALNVERAALHLPKVALDPALGRAAQAHADDMAAKGYFDVTSPEGRTIEAWIGDAGYKPGLFTEKLVRAGALDTAADLAAEWRREPSEYGKNLFHPDVLDIGIGIAWQGRDVIYAVVLARSKKAGRVVVAAAGDGELGELKNLRKAFLEAVNRERKAAGITTVRSDSTLDRAAQSHAEALLRARLSGDERNASVEPLAQRVQRESAGTRGTATQIGTGAFGMTLQAEGPSHHAVGEAIVVDAVSPAEAVDTALAHDVGSALRDAAYLRLGLGVASHGSGDDIKSVWVACLMPLK